jgi:hypothetical protein
MKICFKVCVLVAFLSQTFAASEEANFNLTSKVLINESTGFYTLSDGSFWKVFNFSPRWRTISEWWNDVKLIPEAYDTAPQDWYIGADLEVISKLDHLDAKESDSSHKNLLARCTHIIRNTGSNKCLFAVELKPETLLVELYNDTYKSAYEKGYYKGQLSSDLDASKQYEKGYEAGYYQGRIDASRSR